MLHRDKGIPELLSSLRSPIAHQTESQGWFVKQHPSMIVFGVLRRTLLP